MDKEVFKKYEKAGRISKSAKSLARKLVVEGANLETVANKIEEKIYSLGGKLAFPVNLSINDMAAHYVPIYGDKTIFKKGDLVKIDIGVHVDGYIADTAISMSIGKDNNNEKIIRASEEALTAAIELIKSGIKLTEIGKAIQDVINSYSLQTIRNLRGHTVDRYIIHGGISIPNYDSGDKAKLEKEMVIAVEPFSSTGEGIVVEGKKSEVYEVIADKNIRQYREVLNFIQTEFKTLPFCKRQLVNEFGLMKATIAIRQLIQRCAIREYNVLREKARGSKVAQTEHTIIVGKKPIIIT